LALAQAPPLAEREARWRFSAIFDKVGSSGIVKVLQNPIFVGNIKN